MLPDNPTRPPREASAKIIPLRRPKGNGTATRPDEKYATAGNRVPLSVRLAAAGRRERSSRDDARHYLKFMLPGIPVTTFVLTFLYGYLLQGMHTLVLNGHATEQSYAPVVDPTLPLIGALLVAFATGMLCLAIYCGYQRISERVTGDRSSQ
ncbi:MAG TPA: hypothetical protein VF120_13665 [Ktedonobacterales bacterium]